MISFLLATLISVLGVVVFVTVYFYLKLRKYLETKYEVDKIPGPPALPLFGNLLQVVGTRDKIFSNMRHMINMYGPYPFRAYIGPDPGIQIMSPDDVEITISSIKNHAKGKIYSYFHNWLGTGLLTSQGEKWHNRRKILTPSFHFNILQQYIGVFNEHTGELIKEIRESCVDQEGINVVPCVTKYTLKAICQTAMGITLSDDDPAQLNYRLNVENFGHYVLDRIMNPLCYFKTIYRFTKLSSIAKDICGYLHSFSDGVIKEREKEFRLKEERLDSESIDRLDGRKGRKLAMLDILLSAKYHKQEIDDEGIREEVDTFIFEGHDTTAASICFTLMLLACNKDCQDKAYEEIIATLDPSNPPTYNELCELKYLERCIKESLRLYPSVPIISRVSDGISTSEGYNIPKGCMINILIYDMHRRPDLFPDPEKFDPERFLPENTKNRHPFAYIPFSAGPRNCIGQRFAILEIKTVLVSILSNFILEPVDTPKTVALIPDLILRAKDGVKVKFLPRVGV